jgi:outer membrane protein assembly factor BamB
MRYRLLLVTLGFLFYAAASTPARAGILYVATGDGLDEITPNGSVSTLTPSISVSTLGGMGVDSSGNVYVGAGNSFNVNPFVVEKVTPSGSISTFATFPSLGYTITAVAVDSAGNVYVGFDDGDDIDEISADGNVSLYATGQFASTFSAVNALALGPQGTLYIDDPNGLFEVPAGGGAAELAFTNVQRGPGFAVDSSGSVYSTSQAENADEILKFSSSGSSSVFATLPGVLNNTVIGLAFDSSGNMYAANSADGDIFEISPSGVVTPFATVPGNPYFLAYSPTLVPEPATATLFAAASLLVLARRPRKNFLATDGKSDSHR